MIFHQTLQTLCPRIYAVEDEHGAASRLLLAELRARALAAGLEIITCACPLSPYDKLEHLLIPSLGLGFTTSGGCHKADFPVYRRIHAARFTDADRLRQKRQILSFNRRAAPGASCRGGLHRRRRQACPRSDGGLQHPGHGLGKGGRDYSPDGGGFSSACRSCRTVCSGRLRNARVTRTASASSYAIGRIPSSPS